MKRVVIDHGVVIPEGLVVGEDPVLDAKRFRRIGEGHLPDHPGHDRQAGRLSIDGPMQVLAVASEIFPLIKTGGLADVAGALPLALAEQGVTMRTLVPGYPVVMGEFKKKKPVLSISPRCRAARPRCCAAQVARARPARARRAASVRPAGGPYGDATGADWPDNWRRFAALSQVGADIAAGAIPGWRPTSSMPMTGRRR